MKITDVTVFPLEKLPDHPDVPVKPRHSLLRVDTDEGVYGWGSCSMPSNLVKVSLNYLFRLIIGQNPLEVDKVTEQLDQSAYWIGRGGVITVFISGLNIALWDILGKATNMSVARLLGGRFQKKVKPYASLLFRPVDRMPMRLQAAAERSFRAFKLGWAPFGRIDASTDEALVRMARDVIGSDLDLMVDAGGSAPFWRNDLKWAENTSNMLREYGVRWFEEPLADNNMEGYKALRRVSPVWIATGECLRRRKSFYPWIEQRAVDVLQPDLNCVGGISEGRRIAWAANDNGILTVFHGYNTGVGLAADLQLTAALPHAAFVEYRTPMPYVDDILTEPFQIDGDGYLRVPDTPGLGVDVDVDKVKRFAD